MTLHQALRASFVLAVLAAGCGQDLDHRGETSPGGAGGGGGTGSLPGGQPDGGGGGPAGTITGSLCRLEEPRDLDDCSTLRNSELTVTVAGGSSAQVRADGTFEVDAPAGATSVALLVKGGGQVWFGAAKEVSLDAEGEASGVTIPVMALDDVVAVVSSSGASWTGGAVLVVVAHDGAQAKEGVRLPELAQGAVEPLYSTDFPLVYATGTGTQDDGVAVYFDAPPGPLSLDVVSGGEVHRFDTRSFFGALTVADIDLAASN